MGEYVAFFQLYMSFMFFAVLNVVVGVFCNSAIESAQKDEAAVVNERIASKQAYEKQLRGLFMEDELIDGKITLDDLERKFRDETMVAWFEVLEIEVQDGWTLFKLLDTCECNAVDLNEFVDGCLRLKGHARSLDVARLSYENRWVMNKLVRMSKDVYSLMDGVSQLR